jgi:ADP-ribose pyrophosphatase YjhB (NUDIX family)
MPDRPEKSRPKSRRPSILPPPRRDGGTGRRGGLKIRCPKKACGFDSLSRVSLRVPEGDFLPRHVCDACGEIHYQNPKLVVGSVPEFEGRILICKRGIEPRLGYWTIPAGFMENDETLEVGAAREALEEACIDVEIGSLLLLANVTYARQVHVFFRSRMRTPRFATTPESLEVRLVEERDIPWAELAFPSTEAALRHFVADRAAGVERHHVVEMQRRFQ